MKIKLLSAGGFVGLENVEFPVEVEAVLPDGGLYQVSYENIMKIEGAFYSEEDTEKGSKYSFFSHEIEVLR